MVTAILAGIRDHGSRALMTEMVGSMNVPHYVGCKLLNLESIFVFFFKECTVCSESDSKCIDDVDESTIIMIQGMWYDHLKQFRIKSGYNLLSTIHPFSMPKRLRDKISALQQPFIMDNNCGQIKNKMGYCWVYEQFYIIDLEIYGHVI